eukprot:504287-Prorocentrum_minimum.AAC.1
MAPKTKARATGAMSASVYVSERKPGRNPGKLLGNPGGELLGNPGELLGNPGKLLVGNPGELL